MSTPTPLPLPKGYKRLGSFPIDSDSIFHDVATMEAYVSGGSSYIGQPISLVDVDANKVYLFQIQPDKSYKLVGGVDDKNKGWKPNETALLAEHPIGQDGWFVVIGETDTFWTWDSDTEAWVDTNKKEAPIAIDAAPTDGSTNPVSSGGVFEALATKAAKEHEQQASSIKMADGTNAEIAINETRRQEIEFTTAIPFTSILTSMPPTRVTGEMIFTPITENAVPGARCVVVFTASGNINYVPAFSTPFKEAPESHRWNNNNGVLNTVEFWFDGVNFWYRIAREVSDIAYKNEVLLKGGLSGNFIPQNDHDPVPKKWAEDMVIQKISNFYPSVINPGGDNLGWYGIEFDEGRPVTGCKRRGTLAGYPGGGAYGENSYSMFTQPQSNIPESLLFVHNRIKKVMLLDNGTVNYDLDSVNGFNKSGVYPSIFGTVTTGSRLQLISVGSFPLAAENYVGHYVHNTTSGKTNRYCKIAAKLSNDVLVIEDPRSFNNTTNTFDLGDTFEIMTANFSGADGQVMVKIPKFYIRHTYEPSPSNPSLYLMKVDISNYPYDDFQVHPAFVDAASNQVDAIYFSAFEGYVDVGTMCSLPGYLPTVNKNIVAFREYAQNRGVGWQQQMYWYYSAMQLLFYVEYADLNSDYRLPSYIWRNGFRTSDFIKSGRSLQYGNASGIMQADPYLDANIIDDALWLGDKVVGNSYRGIENLWGGIWKFLDGANVYEKNLFVTNDKLAIVSDVDFGYEDMGLLATGYYRGVHPKGGCFVPKVAGGSSVSGYADNVWTSVGWRVCLSGGPSSYGAQAGVGALYAHYASASAATTIGSRLCF